MALDVMLLANQVRDMTKLVVDGASERRRRRMMVQQTIDKHVGHESHWNDAVVLSERAAWLMAQASESFHLRSPGRHRASAHKAVLRPLAAWPHRSASIGLKTWRDLHIKRVRAVDVQALHRC